MSFYCPTCDCSVTVRIEPNSNSVACENCGVVVGLIDNIYENERCGVNL